MGGERCHLPVEDNDSGTDSGYRNVIAPELQHKIECCNLKRNKQGLVEEEVPASHKAERVIDPVASHSDKSSRYWHEAGHFGHSVVYQCDDNAVSRVGDKHAQRPTVEQRTTNTHEQCSSDRTTNSDELDLTISKMALQVVRVVGEGAGLNVMVAWVGFPDELARVLLLLRHGRKGFVAQAVEVVAMGTQVA
jgi:hypothetical protein